MSGLVAQQIVPGEFRNPFPGVPEVRLVDGSRPVVTVETEAVRKARAAAIDYLDARGTDVGRPRDTGRILALVGDLGSGKSHIAGAVVDQVRKRDGLVVVTMVYAKVGDTLLDLYRRLFQSTEGVRSGDAAGGVLLRVDVERAVDRLRDEVNVPPGRGSEDAKLRLIPRQPDPHAVESVLRLRKRLTEVAGEDPECGYALSLLLHEHNAISDAAWAWLRGAEPTKALIDRGVRTAITDDRRAVGVLGVLALLLGMSGRRFVLVVDELQNLGKPEAAPPQDLESLINPLLAWASASGAFLVLCGLSDFWRALPEAVRQRVGQVVRPSPLSEEEIRQYIKAAQSAVNGERRLAPFGLSSIKHIRAFTGGHPRKVINLCHYTYRLVGAEGRVTLDEIKTASQEISGPETSDDVLVKISELFGGLGHHVRRRQHKVAGAEEELVYLDIPLEAGRHHCSIVVSDSVVDDDIAQGLGSRARLIGSTGESPSGPVVLVVVGYLSAALADTVRESFDRVLNWGADDFTRNLAELIGTPAGTGGQAETATFLRDLRLELVALHAARRSDRELLERILQEGGDRQTTHNMVINQSFGFRETEFVELELARADVSRLFNDVLRTIHQARERAERLWHEVFQPGSPVTPSESSGGSAHLDDLVAQPVVQAMGVLAALHLAVQAFGLGVKTCQSRADLTRSAVRGELRSQQERFDLVAAELVRQLPDYGQDLKRRVPYVLAVDKQIIQSKVLRFGSTVYETIYNEDFRRR
ncbi:BREX system ATP-binding domain-containing protein [Rhizohabitans arisaemae]|uniref:BREX system ATP-binding domain-containing protein n=1 Tax=Rhizohabitans arisaemae TaxID=2720610 RepID=UPI0024B04F44|nr:BREX system ATP-binding domain-containing protein [Rhizohabitans arisaemae]